LRLTVIVSVARQVAPIRGVWTVVSSSFWMSKKPNWYSSVPVSRGVTARSSATSARYTSESCSSLRSNRSTVQPRALRSVVSGVMRHATPGESVLLQARSRPVATASEPTRLVSVVKRNASVSESETVGVTRQAVSSVNDCRSKA
jgi:hypothetical protein